MITSEIAIEEKLCQFIKEYADDQYCLELVIFLGRHPCTRFSQLAIVHALDRRRLYIERALRRLISKGVVTTSIENNVPVYSLTENESLANPVLALAKLDWYQWQRLLGQLYPTSAV